MGTRCWLSRAEVLLHWQCPCTTYNYPHASKLIYLWSLQFPLFSKFFKSFPRPKVMQIYNLSTLNRDCRQQKIGCLLKVTASCLQLLVIQHIMNHWFNTTINNVINSYENSMILQSFSFYDLPWPVLLSMTYHDLCCYQWLSRPGQWSN